MSTLQERIDFYGFDRVTPKARKGVSKALNRAMDKALDAFYDTIANNPDLGAYFDDASSLKRARGLQEDHWTAVFRDGVDERFEKRALHVGAVHARIGLPPRWYLGSYSQILERLIEEIVAPGGRKLLPGSRAKADEVNALVKVALLDINFALSAYFNEMEKTRAVVVESLGDALEKVAEGDLTVSLSGLPDEFAKVEEDFNRAIGSLSQTVTAVVSGVETMTTGSSEIQHASNDLARRTEEQAANLEETAAAVAQSTQRVQEAAKTTDTALETISSTSSTAKDGAQVVSEAVAAMDEIEKSSAEINNIISVIESIAFQTNLLALNAGVEAARAGETGKGFAVVASEVRALAQRCGEAADEIKNLISSSNKQVSSGVDLVKRSGEAFSAIVSGVDELQVAIRSIAESTNSQAASLSQINSVVADLDRSTQQNAAMAEQSNAAATNLAHEATVLGNTMSYFSTHSSVERGLQTAHPAQQIAA
ncbi:globin-coupled sensor protein [Erythrobacter sp. SCSIO 43205]|uniref:methyl-accepting chemotaxis protein n=1 Tax=Erythrobacter sp. SCSIO 43205 TaxID=2779361 RepID=UPI001CA9A679|nr:methyl-accepting chemotaxis protein [Erythrobacter sp. SCSIO 43205]UAB78052.1 globin-coupled sensor protein [Erythrobacter sp. SCSIO 43205]